MVMDRTQQVFDTDVGENAHICNISSLIVNAVRLAGCFIICWARVWGSGARWLHGPQAPAPWKGANSAQHQSGVTRDCGSPCELEAEFFPERFLDLCFG